MATRTKNAHTHPGRVVLDAQQKRRTRNQIEEDEASARSTAIALQEDAAAKKQAVMARIADLEESVEQEERMVQKYRNRPDLRQGIMKKSKAVLGQRPPRQRASIDEMGEDEDEDEDYTYTGDAMPSDSTVANEAPGRSDDDDDIDEEVLDDGMEREWDNRGQNRLVGLPLGFRFTQLTSRTQKVGSEKSRVGGKRKAPHNTLGRLGEA